MRRYYAKISVKKKPLVIHYSGKNPSVLQCFISYNQYGGYCVPQSSLHRPAAQKILCGNVWEPDTIQYMMDNCLSGDIVHAGTYFGDFIPALSGSLHKDAILWAFEPNPENYRCAEITCKLNNLKNVNIRNAGLGHKNSIMKMNVTDNTGRSLGGASHLMKDTDTAGNTIDVDIVAIDNALPPDRSISILQLDVEGFEQYALEGAMQTIKRNMPVLILENLPDMKWLEQNILALGYKLSGRLHENHLLLPV